MKHKENHNILIKKEYFRGMDFVIWNIRGEKEMNIVTDRAEEGLLERLRAGQMPENGYCLHVRGRAFDQKEFEALPELICRWVGHEGGEMFICLDHDIFMFSPNLSPESFALMKKHAQTRFEGDPVIQSKAFSFYDIERNGPGLIELAEFRLAGKKERQKQDAEKKRIETREMQRLAFLEMGLNEGLVRTLEQRRQGGTRLEILVVEDDPFSRKLISTALSPVFSVSFAHNGASAVTRHLQKAPDIVFLDIDLPDVTGHDVLAKLRSFDPRAYIVMFSGNSQGENVRAAVKAGAKGFVGKPFTKDKLLQYIGKCPKNQFATTGA